jgi:sugar phosphate isomerase/epimerase
MLTRRAFMQQAGVLASASVAASRSASAMSASPFKPALQLYTLRRALAADLEGTLQRVAAMGYQEVETYGFDPAGLRFYGLDAKAFAERLRAHGLAAISGHYDLNRFVSTPVADLTGYVDRCIDGARILGSKYITWPFLDPGDRTIEKFKVVADRLNVAGERVKKAGLGFAYHNHDFEFVEQEGQIGYDVILQRTDPALVKLQMDLYWIAHGSKLTPHQWFQKQPGRFVMWHVKDMHRVSRDYTEVGNGTIDFTAIWPDTKLAGLEHFFVEQGSNFTHDAMRSVADSAEYVKRVLLK